MQDLRTNGWTTSVTFLPNQQNSSEPIIVRLRSFDKGLAFIFGRMRSSSLFMNDEAKLQEWSTNLLQLDFNNQDETIRRENARQLSFFFLDAIRSKNADRIPQEEKEALYAYEDEIRSIIQLLLPYGVDAVSFIEECEDEIFQKEELEKNNACLEEMANRNNFYVAAARLNSNPRVRMDALLDRMIHSGLISPIEMGEWEVELRQLDFNTEDRNGQIRNGLVIGFFLSRLIHPAILAGNVEYRQKLLVFRNQLKVILENILPNDIVADRLIKETENIIDEEIFKREKAQSAAAFYQEQLERIDHYLAIARANLNPAVKIASLFEGIRNSQIFAGSEPKLNEWETELRQLNFDTDERNKQEDNALLLCLFLYEVIRPALLATQNAENMQQLLAFEDRIRNILKRILPEDREVENFIQQFERELDAEIVLRRRFEMIRTCFQRQIEELHRTANEANQDIKQRCRILKQRLRDMIEMRKAMSEEMFRKIDALNQKVKQLLQQIEQTGQNIQAAGDRMEAEHQNFNRLLLECENLLRRV